MYKLARWGGGGVFRLLFQTRPSDWHPHVGASRGLYSLWLFGHGSWDLNLLGNGFSEWNPQTLQTFCRGVNSN